VTAVYEAGQALARHLVVELGYIPLEQALPGLQPVSQSLDGALAVFERQDLRVHAWLLDEEASGVDHYARQAEVLRSALQAVEERIPGRVRAYLWVLTQTPARAQALRDSFLNFEDGHFLAKTLVGRGVLSVDQAQGWSMGRLAAQPSAHSLAAWIDPNTAPAPELAQAQLQERQVDESQARRLLRATSTPVTWGLIAANIGVYLWQLSLSSSLHAQGLNEDLAWNQAMLRLGANDPALSIGQGQVWRWFAACFLHASLPHIVMNMLSLFSLGALAERLCGPWRLLGVYLACGIAGSALSAALGKAGIPSLGASGAILGLAGLLLAPHWRRDPRFPKDLSNRLFSWLARPIGFIFALGFAMRILDLSIQIDNFAHLGGLLCGFAVAYIYPPFLIKKTDRKG
jgi:rhomboid protease GluP